GRHRPPRGLGLRAGAHTAGLRPRPRPGRGHAGARHPLHRGRHPRRPARPDARPHDRGSPGHRRAARRRARRAAGRRAAADARRGLRTLRRPHALPRGGQGERPGRRARDRAARDGPWPAGAGDRPVVPPPHPAPHRPTGARAAARPPLPAARAPRDDPARAPAHGRIRDEHQPLRELDRRCPRARRPCARARGAGLHRQRRARDGAADRPRGRRDHHRRPRPPARRARRRGRGTRGTRGTRGARGL
ncbi:MAG: Glycerophosphoryl diester phosphodiesterase, partial [uncultured Solirubrobacteraceae bacterium]